MYEVDLGVLNVEDVEYPPLYLEEVEPRFLYFDDVESHLLYLDFPPSVRFADDLALRCEAAYVLSTVLRCACSTMVAIIPAPGIGGSLPCRVLSPSFVSRGEVPSGRMLLIIGCSCMCIAPRFGPWHARCSKARYGAQETTPACENLAARFQPAF